MGQGMLRSGCPVAGFDEDCRSGCEWFVEPSELVPTGGCVIVLLFKELLSMRIPRRKAQA